MKVKIPWKYIFYTPTFYTDEYYINPASTPIDTKFILVNHDTVMKNGISPILKLPQDLILHKKNDSVIFVLVKQFQDNIDETPTINFNNKLDSGPFLKND